MRTRTWIAGVGLFAIGIAALISAPRWGHACPCNAAAQAAPEEAGVTRSVTLSVDGMDCAACTAAIRIALKKLDGVKEAKVSYPDMRAVVDYDPARVTPDQMVAAIVKLGYKARVKG